MPVSLSGRDFKAFYNDQEVWSGDGAYLDEMQLFVDEVLYNGQHAGGDYVDGDVEKIPDEAKVRLDYGSFFKTGDSDPADLVSVVRRWLKKRDSVTLIVSAPQAKLEAIRAAIKAAGGSIEA